MAVGDCGRRRKGERGFTLVEVMVVIAILAILAAIAIPIYSHYVKDAKYAQAKSDLVLLSTLMERYYQDQNAYYPTTTNLQPNTSTNPTLPGWEPGNGMLFSYNIVNPDTGMPAQCNIPTPASGPSYLLSATPLASSGLSNTIAFYLDSNNNRCEITANGTAITGW
ncbi:MAG: prepilin-type N-terminal cleavage/methylation domain-containing protein [Gammaproteobacteria bacterium]|nr:prepilin-type N-terminal cleavage/methylation domain-containing protein [Gammaproteobacteria bacterium]